MKRKLRIISWIIALAFVVPGTWERPCGAADDAALLLRKADESRRALLGSSSKRKYRDSWLECINLYKKIYFQFSESNEAAWALYQSGRLFTGLYKYSGNSRDLDEACHIYKELIEKHPDHRLADDAQYLIGEIFYRHKKDPTQAYIEFLKVDIKYPSGDMRLRARKMLDELEVILSKKDLEMKPNQAGSSGFKPVAVKEIRHWSTPHYTRVVVDLENPVEYEHHLLKEDRDHKKPRRLYLDLKNAYVTSEIDSAIPIKDELLKGARAGQFTKDTVRVVLDMESVGDYKVFHLYDPFRIVADIRKLGNGGGEDEPRVVLKKRSVQRGVRKSKVPSNKLSLASQLGLSVNRIVIDPGHGGKDPGCHLGKGIREKDIVLNVAKMLARKIREEIGCEVFLTRDKDVYLSLEQRTAIANMHKADLFISLHVNAHSNARVWGLETYFLNMATDEEAVMVAARENATSQKNISDLKAIINGLMLNTKINESSRLAHRVQQGMVSSVESKYGKVNDLGVKQAPFYVLIGAEMPAILVETGFLSNRNERGRLLDTRYQDRMAQGICEGIGNYIESINQIYQGG